MFLGNEVVFQPRLMLRSPPIGVYGFQLCHFGFAYTGDANVTVGGAVAHPAACSESDVRLSHSSGSSVTWGNMSMVLRTVCLLVTVRVKQHQVGVPAVSPVAVSMVDFYHILCRQV